MSPRNSFPFVLNELSPASRDLYLWIAEGEFESAPDTEPMLPPTLPLGRFLDIDDEP